MTAISINKNSSEFEITGYYFSPKLPESLTETILDSSPAECRERMIEAIGVIAPYEERRYPRRLPLRIHYGELIDSERSEPQTVMGRFVKAHVHCMNHGLEWHKANSGGSYTYARFGLKEIEAGINAIPDDQINQFEIGFTQALVVNQARKSAHIIMSLRDNDLDFGINWKEVDKNERLRAATPHPARTSIEDKTFAAFTKLSHEVNHCAISLSKVVDGTTAKKEMLRTLNVLTLGRKDDHARFLITPIELSEGKWQNYYVPSVPTERVLLTFSDCLVYDQRMNGGLTIVDRNFATWRGQEVPTFVAKNIHLRTKLDYLLHLAGPSAKDRLDPKQKADLEKSEVYLRIDMDTRRMRSTITKMSDADAIRTAHDLSVMMDNNRERYRDMQNLRSLARGIIGPEAIVSESARAKPDSKDRGQGR